MNASDWLPLLPILLVALTGLLLMLLQTFTPSQSALFGGVSLSMLACVAVLVVVDWVMHPLGGRTVLFNGALTIDSFSQFFNLLLITAAGLTIVSGWAYVGREHMGQGEVYALLMFALTGMMTLASGSDLITLFVGVEVMSIAIYVLVGARRHALKGGEAAIKYFLLGAFSSGVLLYGIALTYGTVGSVKLEAIGQFLAAPDAAKLPLLVVGLAMLLIGMGFKVAAAPFHAWTPDVYEGAPSPITGFMATAVKAASFALMLRVLGTFMPVKHMWVDVIAGLAIITMFAGNLMAFVQVNVKRMLAYSSIAHTGYLLMGVVALSADPANPAGQAILYYLVAYALTNIGAFAIIGLLSKQGEKLVEIADFAGAASKFPLLAFTLAVFMASLIGLPPTAGFFGKYFLFTAVIQNGYAWLAVIGIINSILSVYYYLRVVLVMYMQEPKADWTGLTGLVSVRIVALTCAVVVVWAGFGAFNLFELVPGAGTLLGWAKTGASVLF